MFMGKFGPTALNFGSKEFFLSIYLGHPANSKSSWLSGPKFYICFERILKKRKRMRGEVLAGSVRNLAAQASVLGAGFCGRADSGY